MKKLSILVLAIILTTALYAQPSFMKSVNAYTAEKKLGRKPVNLDGTETFVQPDSITYVFIETRGASPVFSKAFMHNRQYQVIVTAINRPTNIGMHQTLNKSIIVKPKSGNRLWQLELIDYKILNKPVNAANRKIIIQGTNNKKFFEVKVKEIIPLELPDAS